MQDSNSLHWLKEFPAQFILTFLFIVTLAVYVQYQIQFLERIIDLIAGGLLTTLIGTRRPTTTVNADNVTAETIQTPNMSAENMTDTTINTDSFDPTTLPKATDN